MTAEVTNDLLTFRSPCQKDGEAIWKLIQGCPPLDVNSCYAYLLLCTHFADTCVVAERQHEIVGFISAYYPPGRPEVIFIWQVAVKQTARGQGVAGAMLRQLLARDVCQDVVFLETTISPSNAASQALFRGLAAERHAACDEECFFAQDLFGAEAHEEETLFRIGPLSSMSCNHEGNSHG